MLKPAVIDLSHHNEIPQSLVPAKQAGILGCIHKVTEGTSFIDDKISARRFLADEAGMAWGMYHFLRPGSMQAQADFFAKIAKQNGDRDTLICCDFEVAGIALAEVAEFMRIISDMGQRSAVLYTGHSLKDALIAGEDGDELKQYRLWLAQYCEGEPDLPQGWDRWWLWQYSQSGEIEGIMAPTDVNAYDGEAEQLLREWSGSGREPRPPMPEPVTVAMTLTIDAPPGIAVTVNGQAV